MTCKCNLRTKLVGDGCEECNPELANELACEAATEFMDAYWPGWYCGFHRCGHYRLAEENSPAWCWLRHGIGAEGRETECPAYKREMRLKAKRPNAK
jgi:hypothetical protein